MVLQFCPTLCDSMDCSPPGSRSNAEEAEVERFYEDLQDLLELTRKKDVLFIIGPIVRTDGTPLWYSCLENPMDGGDW